MQKSYRTKMMLLVGAVLPLAGCPQLTRPVEFQLGEGLGVFAVAANTPTRQSRLVTLDTGGITLGSGSLEIVPSEISIVVTEGGGGKLQVRLHEASLTVTAWVAPADELATVFETGDEYGPYTVTIFDDDLIPGEDFEVVSVSPSTINLTAATIDLLNGGEFSLGLEVVSPVDGTVTIASLTFNLGL